MTCTHVYLSYIPVYISYIICNMYTCGYFIYDVTCIPADILYMTYDMHICVYFIYDT